MYNNFCLNGAIIEFSVHNMCIEISRHLKLYGYVYILYFVFELFYNEV